jgi:hypothetical protein
VSGGGSRWATGAGAGAATCAVAALSAALASCGGCASSSTVSSAAASCVLDAAVPATGLGRVVGTLYADGSGNVVAVRGAAPAGDLPLAGASVGLASGPQSTTDASGHFELDGVPAGAQLLGITPPGGASTTLAVHSIPGALVTAGDPAISRDSAVQIVAGYAASVGASGASQTYGTHQPIPAGVTLGTGIATSSLAAAESCVATESWLFEVDPYPEFLSEHAVRLVLIDAKSGALTARVANAWPTANGAPLFHEADANLAAVDVVAAATAPNAVAPSSGDLAGAPDAALTGQSASTRARPRFGPPPGRKYGIIILGDGSATTGFALGISKEDFSKFLIAQEGVDSLDLTIISPRTANVVQQIQTALATVKQNAQPCDSVYIAVFAHGVMADEPSFSVEDQTGDSLYLGKNTIDLTGLKAQHVFLFFETCGSGGWIRVMQSQLDPSTEAVVVTSTDSSHPSAVNIIPGLNGVPGARFTNYFLAAAASLPTPVDYVQAYDGAMHALNDDSNYSTSNFMTAGRASASLSAKPQLWSQAGSPGSCDDAGVEAGIDASPLACDGGLPNGTSCTDYSQCCSKTCPTPSTQGVILACCGGFPLSGYTPTCSGDVDCCPDYLVSSDGGYSTQPIPCTGGLCCRPGLGAYCVSGSECCGYNDSTAAGFGGTSCDIRNKCCARVGTTCQAASDCCQDPTAAPYLDCQAGKCCELGGLGWPCQDATWCCSGNCAQGVCQ